MDIERLIKSEIRNIPDYPKKGVMFKDITPLLNNNLAFPIVIDALARQVPRYTETIVGIESRGFIFGAALAYKMSLGFVPVRKAGKLPYEKNSIDYDLEYGKATIEMHKDALEKGKNVLIVDDVLATGGTAEACGKLIKNMGGSISAFAFIIELTDLKGREKLKPHNVIALAKY